MRKYRIPIAAAVLVSIVVFLFAGCDTTKQGAPSSPPTVEQTYQLLQTTNVGYPPESDPSYGEFSNYFGIFIIDLFIMVANMYLDPDAFPWQGSDGSYSFSYSYGDTSFTVTLTVVWDSGRGMWHYTLVYDGTYDTGSGIEAFNNYTLFDLYAKPDGSEGEVTFYTFDSTSDYLSVSWIKDSTYITFTMTMVSGTDTYNITLKETIPVYNETQGEYVSESGIIKIEVSGVAEPTIISWGSNPPSLS